MYYIVYPKYFNKKFPLLLLLLNSLIFNGSCTQYKNLQEIVKPNY